MQFNYGCRVRRIFFAGLAATVVLSAWPALGQGVDCIRLQQQIAVASDGGAGRLASAARRQNVELARTSAYARQLGCDRQGFAFFGGGPPPQCDALNARIGQMQANLGQLQAGSGGGGRADLIARFNASCRGGQQSAALQPPRQRGFFESLFGGPEAPRPVPQADLPSVDPSLKEGYDDDEGNGAAHGGSQAVCVRTCDGGFFPMNMSARHNEDSLNEMCTALCPNTQVSVYTRNPNNDIKTAVSLDGSPYMDLPNALKFQKSFDSTCTCRPAEKTWAEALVGAENALGKLRKGDILVTPEKSAELSRPKLDSKTRASILNGPGPTETAAVADPKASLAAQPAAAESTGPDGVKRRVRQVGPQL